MEALGLGKGLDNVCLVLGGWRGGRDRSCALIGGGLVFGGFNPPVWDGYSDAFRACLPTYANKTVPFLHICSPRMLYAVSVKMLAVMLSSDDR